MTQNKKQKIDFRIWAIWLCGAGFYLYQFILRVSPSVMDRELMNAFSIHGCALGILGASYYNTYSFLQVPMGTLIDHFGPRRVVSLSVFSCVLGAFIFGGAPDVKVAALGRMFMGAGSAAGFIGALTLARLWLPSYYMGFAIGVTMFFGTAGAVLGQAPTVFLIEYIGWRGALFTLGGCGFLMVFLMWQVIRDKPRPPSSQTQKARLFTSDFLSGFVKVISTPQVWLVAFYGCMMYVPLSTLVDLWGPAFIEEMYHTDRKTASILISMITLGVAAGSLLVPMWSDAMKRRKPLMYAGAALSLVIYSAVIYVPHLGMIPMGVLLFLGGVAFTGELLCFACICDLMPVHHTGAALGFLNMTIMLSGVIFQPLVGYLLDYHYADRLLPGIIPHFTIPDFQFALVPVVLGFGFAVILLSFVKETHPQYHPLKNPLK